MSECLSLLQDVRWPLWAVGALAITIRLNWSSMASPLGVSLRTICCHMSDFVLPVRERFTAIEGSQLSFIVKGIKS